MATAAGGTVRVKDEVTIVFAITATGDNAMADREVPVLIVGGSLVGMSTALLLGHHGVRALAVEHHRGTAIHPRAAQITQRTMEIFRTVGVEQIVRENRASSSCRTARSWRSRRWPERSSRTSSPT